jgi:hypothetical protein
MAKQRSGLAMTVAKESSGLQIPEWVPDYIADKARELREKHSGNPTALALIERLTGHPDMRSVWKELTKQTRENYRPTGKPLHKLTEGFATTDRKAALAEFYELACNVDRLTRELPLPNPERIGAKKAEALRADAERLEKALKPPRAGREGAKRLRRAAEVYERIQYKPGDRAKHIACELAHWLKSIFGSPMYKTTATVTSIITGREISQRQVRTWLLDPYG